jgi:4-amino-4-deoxy-L-arabinose transferase-like glycosyltransferase
MSSVSDQTALPGPLLRWLLVAGLASLVLRLWIANALPITGDEAFFYWWGVFKDWGYYDHPPMVGWLIGLMRALTGDATWSIRLPIVLLPLALGAMLWWALSPLSRERAAWAVVFFWLAPINWLSALITTDTPLIFWSVLSVAALLRAEQRHHLDRKAWGLYALSGLFLGCAFLSKYFSVVLGLSYAVYFAAFRRERWRAFVLLVVCALPGPAINIGWNMAHGWPNIMFNVYNRNQDAAFEFRKPLIYIGMLFYLITPFAAWLGWRYRQALKAAASQHRLLATLVVVPLLFFALLSFKKIVGLHWVLSFYPFVFAYLAFALPEQALKACAKGLAWFTGLHVLIVLVISFGSVEQWKDTRLYPAIVRAYKTQEILKQVVQPGTVLMSDGYSPASVYGYTLKTYVPVFGPGKFHARQDDLLVDFSIYKGKTIRVLLSDVPDMKDFTPYFATVTALEIKQNGVSFHAVEGRDFDYEAYRQGVLGTIYQRYYQIPHWLPMTGCPFCVRYCGQVRCQN